MQSTAPSNASLEPPASAFATLPIPCCSTYNLLNWRRLDPTQPVQLGNIACLANFLGGVDEEWFRLIHVQIEQQAASAVAGLPAAQTAAAAGDAAGVRAALEAVTAALLAMQVCCLLDAACCGA